MKTPFILATIASALIAQTSFAADPKEGGRLGPLRREASPITSQLIGNSFRVQGAETAPLLGRTRSAAEGYVAHEWGTFTSVQGAEGVQLSWNPLIAADLPPFVFSTNNPTAKRTGVQLPVFAFAGKTGTAQRWGFEPRQRMETPVIYFYADQPQKVDVAVKFNQGRITEWYPQISENKFGAAGVIFHTMKWTGVELLPGLEEAGLYPKEGKASHYYAARETDATPLRVTPQQGQAQHEKMLFYRGVGGFTAPLNVSQAGDAIRLKVTEEGVRLADAFLYIVRGDKALLEPLGAIDASDDLRSVAYDFQKARPLAEVRADFGKKLQAAIVAGGLYEKEAAAMVKTWDDSWFGEQGMRVLYTLPQTWSDRVLPLTFSPAPREIRRVFVGRAEMFTPSQEWALLKEVVRYSGANEADKAKAVKAADSIGLGRFTDVVINRIYQKIPITVESAQATFGLLEASRPKELPQGWAQAR